MTLRPDAVVHSIIYDDKQNKVTGIRVVDALTKETTEYFAKIIFLNAGAINTNLVLLNSTSKRFPNGLGNDSDTLGKYVAFHNYRARVSGVYEELLDTTSKGRRPTNSYLPRFRNLYQQDTTFLRGYAAGFYSGRGKRTNSEGLGPELRDNLFKTPEITPWRVSSHMMGETIPKESSYVKLDSKVTDDWGMPLLHINVQYDDNDEKMTLDYIEQMSEMFEKAGFTDIKSTDDGRTPGLDIHEMGGVRMGRDPKTSMLNKWQQLHEANNVFVTDGECMTSTSTQNPSLTYMAMAARSANYAADQISKGALG